MQSNDIAEAAVKAAKKVLQRAMVDKSDSYPAILEYRNAPTQALNRGPAQLLLGRKTRSPLPTTAALLRPRTINCGRQKRAPSNKMTSYYNARAKDLPPLHEGDHAIVLPVAR